MLGPARWPLSISPAPKSCFLEPTCPPSLTQACGLSQEAGLLGTCLARSPQSDPLLSRVSRVLSLPLQNSPTSRFPSRVTPRVPAPLHLSPFSPPDGDRRVDPPALSGSRKEEMLSPADSTPISVGDIRDVGLIPGSGRFPWRRVWQSTPVFLPGESHGQRRLEGYSTWGH